MNFFLKTIWAEDILRKHDKNKNISYMYLQNIKPMREDYWALPNIQIYNNQPCLQDKPHQIRPQKIQWIW